MSHMFSCLVAGSLTMMLINEKSRSARNASHTCLSEWDQWAALGSRHYGRKKLEGEDRYNILGGWWVF